jgi:hypothetical protein
LSGCGKNGPVCLATNHSNFTAREAASIVNPQLVLEELSIFYESNLPKLQSLMKRVLIERASDGSVAASAHSIAVTLVCEEILMQWAVGKLSRWQVNVCHLEMAASPRHRMPPNLSVETPPASHLL